MPTDACASGVEVWPAECGDTAPPGTKTIAGGPDYEPAVPFIVYAARRCKNISPADAEAAALRRLAAGRPARRRRRSGTG